MATNKDFLVDRRVRIAMDAMAPKEQVAVQRVLRDKDVFVAHEKQRGATKKIPKSNYLYVMNAGPGLRVIYSKHGDQIVVQDVMRKATADRYILKKKPGAGAGRAKKASNKIDL
jgi:hypothetical protein